MHLSCLITTQAQSSHDTMRKWAYIGAQACANRKKRRNRLETKASCREVLQGALLGCWDRHPGGEGAPKCKASTGRSCSPKGSSGAVPQRSVGENRPSSLHSHGLHTGKVYDRSGAKAGLRIKEMLKQKHISRQHPSPWDEPTFSPEPSRVIKGATTRSLNPHSNLGRNCKRTQH